MLQFANIDLGMEEISKWLTTTTRPALIAIAGMTCSGKTTLAEKLRQLFPEEVQPVPLDNFFREIVDPLLPRNEAGKMLFDMPESYNIPEFVGIINRLIGGYDAVLPYFDKASGRRIIERSLLINPAPIIVAEGLFAISFLKRLKANSLLVYVKATPETCLQRRIVRDVPTFGVTPERVKNIFESKVLPCLHHLTPQERDAQIIITTD